MDVILLVFLFVIGACIGSFLNVVVYRLPRGQSIVFPASHCPSCGRAIKPYDNIPLFSWLILRGRCRSCKAAISPRYILVEFATAVLVAGLYAWYYLLGARGGAGSFLATWPTFASHALLLCGLLACSIIDAEVWIVPLEICLVMAGAGIISATASPHPFMPTISPVTGAMALAGGVGLVVSMVLLRVGVLRPTFIDAQDTVKYAPSADGTGKGKIHSVAAKQEHGLNPRTEVLHELLFLVPPIALAVAAWVLLASWPSAEHAWRGLASPTAGAWGPHVNGFLSSVFGFLVAGAWVWGTRIFGTLAFNKEAMGRGDVDLLAAVGAVTGWVVPSIAFFAAPLFGLLWAVYLWLGRNQKELPYGPWLAAGTFLVMLFYDEVIGLLKLYMVA